jgi:lon-related putative ATP-dependent protease
LITIGICSKIFKYYSLGRGIAMIKPLDLSQLYDACDPSLFTFETTNELEPLEHPVGQERAIEAVEFSANIDQDGYNLYAMGPSGSGKHSVIMNYLEKKSQSEASPSDWCYVNNFKDSRKPIAIELPFGQASVFKEEMDDLIELLKVILPSVFESSDYRNGYDAINQKYIRLHADVYQHLEVEAKKHHVVMNTSAKSRITFMPEIDGKVLSPEEFQAIGGKEKEKINQNLSDFELIVKEGLQKVAELTKAMHKELKAYDQKTTQESVESLIDEVRSKYKNVEKIIDYLDALQADVIRHVSDFLSKPDEMQNMPPFMKEYYVPSFTRYKVNLFIYHDDGSNAPVIYEDNPSHQNLIGRIEHTSQIGTLVTDFSMIKPGSLHKANGGYLIIDVRKLLMQPFAYEELKRVLRSKEVRIESLAEQYSFMSTSSLEPEPIPIKLKVVLIGERMMYYLLHQYDPDFPELFKVNADFEDEIPRSDENMQLYARMIGDMSRRDKLLPLTAAAVARVIEQGSKEVAHAAKFSTHLRTLSDLLKEADYWSKKSERKAIDTRDIEKVLQERVKRRSRIQEKLYEQIDEGTLFIQLEGEAVGQINGLSYLSIGAYAFGAPSRITARTRIGKGEIIDIQRKVELSGPIHAKGVMILSAYLGATYASDMPLSLSATLVFEQSYGMVEGDSASSTELYAILSSLSKVPIKQNIAVTGSVNQFGEIQPIGGANEKIEGFFDICMREDPDAFYAVMIPESNVKHLMLKAEILKAVEKKTFAIYAVKTIDEGIEVLTGVKSDEINKKVVKRLKELSAAVRDFESEDDEGDIEHFVINPVD